jgi:stage V sporulation protein SpoVS
LNTLETTQLKVAANSQTREVAHAIYAVLMKEGAVNVVGIGESAVAKAAKAVASVTHIFTFEIHENDAIAVGIEWSSHVIDADKPALSGITFYVEKKAA